jgi:hypothetical protein
MAERIVNGYRRLFEVMVLHHYWLDKGNVLSSPDPLQIDGILTYDVRPFLTLAPTASTAKQLGGLRCVFRETALGMVVAAPKEALIPDESVFEFVLTIQNAAFFNYTALTLQDQKIYEHYHLTESKTYRYKANVPALSNLTGASRTVDGKKHLFLSKEIPANDANEPLEALVRDASALRQVIAQPKELQELGSQSANLPVFLHQEDAPPIVAPAGLIGTPPARGLLLNSEISDEVYAFIQIAAVHPDDADFSCTENHKAKAPDPNSGDSRHPVFQIRFKNRSSYWRYRKKRSGAVISTEADPLPLTFSGNASGTKQKPSAGLVKPVTKVKSDTDTAVRMLSEIFIEAL